MKLGQHMTDEQRARDSAVHMGHSVSPEACARMSASHKGKPLTDACLTASHTPEATAKRAAKLRGRHPSPEERAHMSAGKMGNTNCLGRAPWNKGIPWSPKARAVLSANHADMRRELNPFWKGGITSENHIIRDSPEYMTWRTAVFERDNYTCQECGAHSGNGHAVVLEAHHIHRFAEYSDERFDVDNGKTLCKKCHDKTKGRRRNVRVQVLYIPKEKP